MPQIKACLFDMDGLLLDSERIYTDSTLQLLTNHGRPALFPMSIKSQMMGRPGPQAADIFLAWSDLPISVDQYVAEQRTLQSSKFPYVAPMPGARTLLRGLADRKVPVGLATSSTTENFKLKTSRLGEMFAVFGDVVICGDDERVVGRGKPMPDIFLHCLSQLNARRRESGESEILPHECLVLEDGVPGVEAGLSAGMQVLWVPDPEILAVYKGQVSEILGDRGKLVSSLEEFPWAYYGL